MNGDELNFSGATPLTPKKKSTYDEHRPPTTDWSLDKVREVQDWYTSTYKKPLPLVNKGQGSIHNRLGYDHRGSADVSIRPDTPEGQEFSKLLKSKNIPFLAFDRAVPGVSSGAHYHLGAPSHKAGVKYPVGTQLKAQKSVGLNFGGATDLDEPKQELNFSDVVDAAPVSTRFGAPRATPKPSHGSRAVSDVIDVTAAAGRLKAPKQLDYAQMRQATEPRDPSIADIRMADNPAIGFNRAQGQPSRVTQTPDELRVVKGEQPANRQAFARQQEAQSRLGQMKELGLEQHDPEKERQWQMANSRRITELTKRYKAAAERAGKANLVGGQWGSEAATKGLGGWTELAAGVSGSDSLRRHAQAMQQAAMELGADRSQASQVANNFLGGLIGTAPELAAMSLGVPPVATFGAGGALRAGGRGEDPNKGALHGAATGLAFEVPGVGEGLKQVATKSGAVGAATAGLELGMGASPQEALTAGLTNAAMVGIPGLVKRGVPEKSSAMQAQLDQRGYTLVPEGTPRPPLPRGTRAEKTADGTVYYDPNRIDAATIRNTLTAELLGHVEPKSETTTETVVARAPDGAEIQSSAVSPENVTKQAEVMQVQYPQAKVETGGPEVAEQVIAERTAPQEYDHLQFGRVVKAESQEGAGKGRTKVFEKDNPEKFHYPRTVDLQGRGNARMIPVKPAEPSATEATLPAQPTASTPSPESGVYGPTSGSTAMRAEFDRRSAERVPQADWLDYTPEEKTAARASLEAELGPPTHENGVPIVAPSVKGETRLHEMLRKGLSSYQVEAAKERSVIQPSDQPLVQKGEPKLDAEGAGARAPEREIPSAPSTTEQLDGKTYTRNEQGHWIREDGRRVAGVTEQRLNEQAATDGAKTKAVSPTVADVSKIVLEPPDSVLAQLTYGKETPIDTKTGVYTARNRRGKEYKFDLHTYKLADGRERLLLSAGKPTELVDAGAIVRPVDGGVVIETLHKGVTGFDNLGGVLTRQIIKRYGKIIPDVDAPLSPAGRRATEKLAARDVSVQPSTYGSTNKLITTERADAARARLKSKLDPSTLRDITDIASALPDLAELGAYHIEAGSRSFAAWSKQFLDEFNEKDRKVIGPHLKDIYERAGKLAGDKLPNITAIKNESTEQLRRSLDQMEIEPPERKSFQQSIDNAVEKGLDKQAEKLVDDVIAGKNATLSNDEAAGVLLRTRELENRYEELHAKNKNDPELTKIEATLDRFTRATKAAGTTTAQDLSFRRATIDQDFKLISMIRQAKEAKGRDLTVQERERIESIVKERDKAIAERDTALEQLNSKRLQKELDRSSRQRSRAETKEKLDAEAVVIRQNIAAEFARLKSTVGRTFSTGGLGTLDPDGIITRNLIRYARNRAKAEVGLKAEALIDDAHALVSDFGVTRRQVAEALVGYGKTPVDRRSEAAKQLADVRGEITRLLKAEDIATGARTAKQQGPKRDLVRNNNRLKELQRQEREWERKFNERDFEPRAKPEPYPYNSEVRKADDRVRIAEAKFRREMERARPGHQFRNLSGVWKAWLLSGLPTQAMNIGGTGSYQAFREVARLPAAIGDATWSGMRQVAGLPAQRSIQGPSPVAMLESVIEGAGKRGLRDFMETLRHGAPKDIMERHQFQEIDFGTNSQAIKTIELLHNVIFRFMSGSDRVFWQGAYRRNLIDRATMQAKNEGVSNVKERARELIDNPTPELKASAEHDAFVSTFNNDNVLSDKIKRARSAVVNKRSLMTKKNAQRLNAAENFALDLVLPFDRTPTNVIARILEASPLGYGKNAAQLAAAAMRGNMPIEHQRQMMQTFGNATAGTALMGLGWYLADKAKGIITVDGYDVYLNVPGLPRINLRIASPAGNILAAGARARTIHDDPKSSNWDYVKLGLKEPINQPLLKATSAINDIGRDPAVALTKLAAKTASSAIPFSGFVRNAAQGLDPADNRYPDNTFTEQFKRNVPFLRESLPTSRVRLLGSEVNKATKEAERLKITIRGATKQEDETPEEFKTREAVQNGNIRTQIENVVALPDYDKASDDDKTKWLKQAAKFASAQTKEQLPERKEKPEGRQFPMPQSKGTGFEAAYPADALSRYERMSPSQRTVVRDSMTRKAKVLLSDPRLSDEQKAEFKKRLDALNIVPSRPRRTMREQFASP